MSTEEASAQSNTYKLSGGSIAMWAGIVGVCIIGWQCQVDTNAATVACIEAGANPMECAEVIE